MEIRSDDIYNEPHSQKYFDWLKALFIGHMYPIIKRTNVPKNTIKRRTMKC